MLSNLIYHKFKADFSIFMTHLLLKARRCTLHVVLSASVVLHLRIGAVSQITTAAHGYYKQDMTTKVPNSAVAVQLVC